MHTFSVIFKKFTEEKAIKFMNLSKPIVKSCSLFKLELFKLEFYHFINILLLDELRPLFTPERIKFLDPFSKVLCFTLFKQLQAHQTQSLLFKKTTQQLLNQMQITQLDF